MGADPYRYYRIEARELLQGLNQGVLELEKGVAEKETVGRLLRLAHTLKGASRVVKQNAVGDLAHAIEDALGPYRDVPGAVPRQRIDELLKLMDAVAARLSSLDPAGDPATAASPARPGGEEPIEAIRVDLGEMDALFDGLIEAGARIAGLAREAGGLEKALRMAERLSEGLGRGDGAGALRNGRAAALAAELASSLAAVHRSLGIRLEQASRELLQSRERASRLRLLPAGALFAPLERAARDAAQSLQKRVEFQASGGEVRLDAQVLGALRAALLHVVRNSVAHGIEAENERIAAGKSPMGRIELSVERRGNRVTFACRDDGRGVDVEAVRRAALRKGIVAADEAGSLGAEEVLRLILRGGVTTSRTVDDVSGRGIGLDVVRETAARLKGEVRVRTEAARGTELAITVPVSLSSLPAILVEAGEITAAIPLDAVPSTRRLVDGDIARSAEGESVLHEGQAVPLMALSRVVGGDPGRGSGRRRSAVIVRSGSNVAAVAVDRILGTSNVVVRHLPSWVSADPVVAGAALDAEGSPQVVLDPEGLVRAARASAGRTAEAPVSRAPILVVDDSLTTRMLEQSILESAGYEVDLAVSGEEALAKARRRKYGVFIVDIEMPGMDGFEFIAQTRADAALREVPAILVTSRASAEDRRRGEQAGACAYIVKSEFDQGRLLGIIRGLVG
jgi:two-component system chemotaxis sensor kinase CheA